MKKSLAVNFTVSYIIGMDQVHPLREWRKANDKTLASLAGDVAVTPSHLSEIERGLNDPSLALAARLSKASGIPIDKFVKQAEAAE